MSKFRNLANVISMEIRGFFNDLDVVWTAAEVLSDIAEWSKLPKSISQVVREILADDLVQESYKFYLAGSVGIDAVTAVASLAIAVAEEATVELIDHATPQASKLLETMMFLLNSDLSSRTFNFWASFAEASVDGDESIAEPWLQKVLGITLERTCWRDDLDHEEWSAYRTDVVEVFEGLSEVLSPEILNTSVASHLDMTANGYDAQAKIVVCSQFLATIFILDLGDGLVLFNLHQDQFYP